MPARRTKVKRVSFKRRVIRYSGHRWEVVKDAGNYLLISRARGGYEMWLHTSLAR